MATYTTNYNLKKPAQSDSVNIDDINGNMDIIDTALAGKEDTTNKVTALSAASTDTQYPSAKCVYDYVDTLVGNADALLGNGVIE